MILFPLGATDAATHNQERYSVLRRRRRRFCEKTQKGDGRQLEFPAGDN
jgi:hypothetical protein